MQKMKQAFTPLICALKKTGKTNHLNKEEQKEIEKILLKLSKDKAQWLPQLAWQTPQQETVRTLYLGQDNGPIISLISWRPGIKGYIHNHNTWGMVACLYGQEENLSWTYEHCKKNNSKILKLKNKKIIQPGTIFNINHDDIHSVNNCTDPNLDNGIAISLHIYGANLEYTDRLTFDPNTHTTCANKNTEFKNAELLLLDQE